MTTKLQKKQEVNNNTIGSILTGVAGAVAIAGVAVAATMALKDGKTRKKVKSTLIHAADQALEYVEALQTESPPPVTKKLVGKSVGRKK